MKLVVDRKWKKSDYTISNLYIDGVKFCNVLEDADRMISSDMDLDMIKMLKVKGQTAIPTGTYKVTLSAQSPKYTKSKTMMAFCKAYMPRLLNVPGYDGVLIHPGNTAADSEGCLLVGKNDVVGKVTNSTYWFKQLYNKMKVATKRGETITIEIK